MKDVVANLTKLGDNFSSKHIVCLHFAEEAIHASKNVVFRKSGWLGNVCKCSGTGPFKCL